LGYNRRLCLVPHTRRFSGQQSLGVEPAVKSMQQRLGRLAKVTGYRGLFWGFAVSANFRFRKTEAPMSISAPSSIGLRRNSVFNIAFATLGKSFPALSGVIQSVLVF
jgi:hypothetical protein